ncbi:hypothetical protein IE53DRAFT_368255 [Violaceomyces palustris]|uniref:Uncharacterized protein n=1 Tax=Violaceomyces palustris TaxID=1673888 RepID=A0ACD0NZG1_9BASI|nr:hypothetical protein IE53DRAFT_368255 [Violaceomyces palustris]
MNSNSNSNFNNSSLSPAGSIGASVSRDGVPSLRFANSSANAARLQQSSTLGTVVKWWSCGSAAVESSDAEPVLHTKWIWLLTYSRASFNLFADVIKAEMPGTSPGRRQPVRGVASHQEDSLMVPSQPSRLATSQPSSHNVNFPPSNLESPQLQNQYRPFSSGMPAPAAAVPIVRGTSSGAVLLPDSPPSTPPASPRLSNRTFPSLVHRHVPESEASNESRDEVFGREHQHTLISQAANALLDTKEDAAAPSSKPRSSNTASSFKGSLSTLNHAEGHLMPATPEMSPANGVRHCAAASARHFLRRIFEDFPEEGNAEDAGVELVCPGWHGAILISDDPDDVSEEGKSKRTLYVSMPTTIDHSLLREHVLAILDAACDRLACETVVICLEREMKDFATVVHGLCYVGGQVVSMGNRHGADEADKCQGFMPKRGLVFVSVEL